MDTPTSSTNLNHQATEATASTVTEVVIGIGGTPDETLTPEQRKLNGLLLSVWACAKPHSDVTNEQLRDLLAQCVPHLRALSGLLQSAGTPAEIPMGHWNARHVAVDKAVLQLIRNALRSDAESGKTVRGEILEELDKATFKIPAPTPPAGALTDDQLRAATLCREAKRVSVSLVQRHLNIGYNAAQQLCQSIIDAGLVPGMTIAPSLTAPRAAG